jgi:hypothetical protein
MQHTVEQRKAACKLTRPVRSLRPFTSRHIETDRQRAAAADRRSI